MTKRPSEDDIKPDISRTKRTASFEAPVTEEENIQSARDALDRLDYKSTIEICSEIVEASQVSDVVSPLLLRSIALGKIGQPYQSVQDVERALAAKQSRSTYLRASYAHLAMAQYQLQLAQQYPIEDEDQGEVSKSDGKMAQLASNFFWSRQLENRNPFRNFSSDLLLKVFWFCDSPSLMNCAATCRLWNASINDSPDLFRNFSMQGSHTRIIDGINHFSSKCQDSMESINLIIEDNPDSAGRGLLRTAISPSSNTLKELWISHLGNLNKTILALAADCPHLKTLSSKRSDRVFDAIIKSPNGLTYYDTLPSLWKPNLSNFVWQSVGLRCNEALLNALQNAKEVAINSSGVAAAWAVSLLSTSSSLERLVIFQVGLDAVRVIPLMNLPNLVLLRLSSAPRSLGANGSTPFFQNLNAPFLRNLWIHRVDVKDLYSLNPNSRPQSFTTYHLLNISSNAEPGEVEASSLIGAIKDWTRLQTLNILLPSSTPSSFWNQCVYLLTPYSRENVQNGYRGFNLLPSLQALSLGDAAQSSSDQVISGTALVNLCAARIMSSKGFPPGDVSLVANGDLDLAFVLTPPVANPVYFRNARIARLTVKNPLAFDALSARYLRLCVPTFISHASPSLSFYALL